MKKQNDITAIKFLKKFRVAVIGFGSQGMAQALNLRDSGITPIIGLLPKSGSRIAARKAGFEIFISLKAVENADIIVILIPDHKHKELFDTLTSEISGSKTFIFAHGLSVAFGLVILPKSCDIILVAPHGPGLRLREMYEDRRPFTAFWAVENDASGHAQKIARSYAAAIGCPRANLFKSTFRDEAVGDIFGEQAVLCGGLAGLIESGFETLVRHGLSPESAYLECAYQLDLIVDLIKKSGPAGMLEKISKTAAYGSLRNKSKLFDWEMARKMEKLYLEIESGNFARDLVAKNSRSMEGLKASLASYRHSPLQIAYKRLAKKLSAR